MFSSLEASEVAQHTLGGGLRINTLRVVDINSTTTEGTLREDQPSHQSNIQYLESLWQNNQASKKQTSSVKFSHSVMSNYLQLHGLQQCQTSLSITNFQSSPRLTSIELVMPSSHLILWRPLLPPSIFPSIRVFSNESVFRIRWPK